MKNPNLSLEKFLMKQGYTKIAGVDEVGRGSWAGPLVVGAVILSGFFQIPVGFGDSKQLKPLARRRFSTYIKEQAEAWSVVETPVSFINKFGIAKATHVAFRKAIKSLDPRPDFVLVDAFYVKHLNRKSQKAIIHGDEKSASIAAASIIAKVYRDDLMKKLSKKYPNYNFARHKGYGTKQHQIAIKMYGFTKIHRTSYNLGYLL